MLAHLQVGSSDESWLGMDGFRFASASTLRGSGFTGHGHITCCSCGLSYMWQRGRETVNVPVTSAWFQSGDKTHGQVQHQWKGGKHSSIGKGQWWMVLIGRGADPRALRLWNLSSQPHRGSSCFLQRPAVSAWLPYCNTMRGNARFLIMVSASLLANEAGFLSICALVMCAYALLFCKFARKCILSIFPTGVCPSTYSGGIFPHRLAYWGRHSFLCLKHP